MTTIFVEPAWARAGTEAWPENSTSWESAPSQSASCGQQTYRGSARQEEPRHPQASATPTRHAARGAPNQGDDQRGRDADREPDQEVEHVRPLVGRQARDGETLRMEAAPGA